MKIFYKMALVGLVLSSISLHLPIDPKTESGGEDGGGDYFISICKTINVTERYPEPSTDNGGEQGSTDSQGDGCTEGDGAEF